MLIDDILLNDILSPRRFSQLLQKSKALVTVVDDVSIACFSEAFVIFCFKLILCVHSTESNFVRAVKRWADECD